MLFSQFIPPCLPPLCPQVCSLCPCLHCWHRDIFESHYSPTTLSLRTGLCHCPLGFSRTLAQGSPSGRWLTVIRAWSQPFPLPTWTPFIWGPRVTWAMRTSMAFSEKKQKYDHEILEQALSNYGRTQDSESWAAASSLGIQSHLLWKTSWFPFRGITAAFSPKCILTSLKSSWTSV